MKQRPGLLLAALTFWGWHTGLLTWGLVMGLLLELPRFLRHRWDLEPGDFRRLWNVTALLFLGAGLYLFFAFDGWGAMTGLAQDPVRAAGPLRDASQGLLRLIQWLPIIMFPFVLVHAFSYADWLPWESVSPLLYARWQRRTGAGPLLRSRGFHPSYPYLVLIVFTASADYRQVQWFFPTLAVLVGWALIPFRSPRFNWVVWGATLVVAAGLGFVGQRVLLEVFRQLERLETQIFNDFADSEFNARGVRTGLDSVRRSKGSGRIVLRVRAPGDGVPPPLLREAVYTYFRLPEWRASRSAGPADFQPVTPLGDETTWRLANPVALHFGVRVQRYSRKGAMNVVLPDGAFELRNLMAGVVETNRLAVARMDGGEALVDYEVRYGAGAQFSSPPDEEDRDLEHLGSMDREVVRRVAQELGLAALQPEEVLCQLERYFFGRFEYSLAGPSLEVGPDEDESPLGIFLERTHRGHCEFFATATTLLLRAGGVPARYVVGYSVQEKRGESYVVRGRHAHAWAQAYVDGRWVSVDNTPASWSDASLMRGSWWEPVYDRLSGFWLAFTQWRQGESQWRLYVFLVAAAVLGFMAWRELRGGRWRRGGLERGAKAARWFGVGLDSEFFQVLEVLERWSAARPKTMPLRQWIEELPLPSEDGRSRLRRILELHYRLRFDPDGLSEMEREELRETATEWLAEDSGQPLIAAKSY